MEHSECTASTLNLGLLNLRSLTSKALIVNETVADQEFNVLLCLTEMFIKPNEYAALNGASLLISLYQPHHWTWEEVCADIYDDNIGVTQKLYINNMFKVLYTNITYAATINK